MTCQAQTFKVWTADYYDSPFQMFPHEHDFIGQFDAEDEQDLKHQLSTAGHEVSKLRWELAEG